jgi:hypothetical protein
MILNSTALGDVMVLYQNCQIHGTPLVAASTVLIPETEAHTAYPRVQVIGVLVDRLLLVLLSPKALLLGEKYPILQRPMVRWAQQTRKTCGQLVANLNQWVLKTPGQNSEV